MFLSLTHPHSRMCIGIYIFNFKKKKEQEYKKQKLAAYGIDDNLVLYIHSYLLNRKQCVCINNILSEFNKVIFGVPQGSNVGA